jgi:hypothetical protein
MRSRFRLNAMIAGGAARATAPVLMFMATAASPACLLPPGVDELTPERNHAPRLLPQSLRPYPTDGPIHAHRDCAQSQHFSGSVVDEDIKDTTYWHVFVDYDVDQQPLVDGDTAADPSDPEQPRLISFSIESTSYAATATDVHTVELLVADRPFDPEAGPPENRVLVNADGLTDSFIWPVYLDPSPCDDASS